MDQGKGIRRAVRRNALRIAIAARNPGLNSMETGDAMANRLVSWVKSNEEWYMDVPVTEPRMQTQQSMSYESGGKR